MRHETAARVVQLMLEFGQRLDEVVAILQQECDTDEFNAYRRGVGRVMGAMLLDVMNPIFEEHPDLKPKDLD